METLEQFAQYKCIIEDCASRWLAKLDSDVGRLVYVSMLRDVSSARYYHPALEQIYSPPAVHQALLYCHEELFEKLLGHSLELLEWDLRMYFAGIDAHRTKLPRIGSSLTSSSCYCRSAFLLISAAYFYPTWLWY